MQSGTAKASEVGTRAHLSPLRSNSTADSVQFSLDGGSAQYLFGRVQGYRFECLLKLATTPVQTELD